MEESYYIDNGSHREGPYDLVTMMRRIRSRKIAAGTRVSTESDPAWRPAQMLPELRLFFDTEAVDPMQALQRRQARSLSERIASGWRFVLEHNVLTVYAGIILLFSFMLFTAFTISLGLIPAAMLTFEFYMIMQNIYLVFTLRLARGQTIGADFFRQSLEPILISLSAISILLSLMIAGGFALLIVPGVLVMALYGFIPFVMADHKYGMTESLYASRMLMQKNNWRHFGTVSMLTFLYLACIPLIIPIPLLLPLYAGAMADIYEEITTNAG